MSGGTAELTVEAAYAGGRTDSFGSDSILTPKPALTNCVFKNGDELWISPRAGAESEQPVSITVRLSNPNGSIERLCLKWGTAAFDRTTMSFTPEWAQPVLRYDEITMDIGADSAHITLNDPARSAVFESADAAGSGEQPSRPVPELTYEDLDLREAEDRKILSYYSGSRRADAELLLSQGRLDEAEELIALLAAEAMKDVRAYAAV